MTSKAKPRVVLVDDHDLFLAGVRGELGDAVEVVGQAGTVAEAVPLIVELDPEVVLLDVHLPSIDSTTPRRSAGTFVRSKPAPRSRTNTPTVSSVTSA